MDCFSLSLKQCRQVKRSSLKSDLGAPAQLLVCAEHIIESTESPTPIYKAPVIHVGAHAAAKAGHGQISLCVWEQVCVGAHEYKRVVHRHGQLDMPEVPRAGHV